MKNVMNRVRKWRLRRGVRLELTAWYGVILILSLTVIGLMVYLLLSGNLRRDAEAQLAARAAQVTTTLDVDEGDFDIQEASIPGELVLLYDGERSLLQSNNQGYSPPLLPTWAALDKGQSAYTVMTLRGERWLMYATHAALGEGPSGTFWLVIGRSLEPIYDMLNQTVSTFMLAGPLVILLACAGGYFLARRALAPVAAITHTARRIQAVELGRRIGMEGRQDELGELASTFDAMLARLEESFTRERRFTANAAHELRTPLAVVQAETTLALRRPRRMDEYKRVLQVVEGESSRMGQLVNDLLALARADEDSHLPAHKSVNLSTLCDVVTKQMSTLACDKGIKLTADIQEGVYIEGDDRWLAQMLTNLLDNGIKYTQSGGWVTLTLERSEPKTVVRLEDNGMGIADEDMPYIFDRFYRAEKSRNRDSETAGFGLGLSICEWVAKTHGGRIEASSRPGQGSCFTVYLPAASVQT